MGFKTIDSKKDKKVLEESDIWVEAQKLTKEQPMSTSQKTPLKQKMIDVSQIESNMIQDNRYSTNLDVESNSNNQEAQSQANSIPMFPQGMFMPQMMNSSMQGGQNGQPQYQMPMMMMPQQMGNGQQGNMQMQTQDNSKNGVGQQQQIVYVMVPVQMQPQQV